MAKGRGRIPAYSIHNVDKALKKKRSRKVPASFFLRGYCLEVEEQIDCPAEVIKSETYGGYAAVVVVVKLDFAN